MASSDLVFKFLGDTKGFSSAVSDAEAKLGGLSGKASQAADSVKSRFGQTQSGVEKFSGSVEKAGKTLGGKLGLGGLASSIGTIGSQFAAIPGPVGIAAGAIAGVGGVIFDLSKKASEYESVHAQLVTALQDSHTTWDAQKQSIDAVEASSRKLGFTDNDVEGALATMTRGMGNAQEAVRYLALAQDVARAKNTDLGSAALAVTKAFEGQLKPLKQLGIDLPVQAGGAVKLQKAQEQLVLATAHVQAVEQAVHDKRIKGVAASDAFKTAADRLRDAQAHVNDVQHSGTDILEGLSQKLKGSASAAAGTFAGKQAELHAQLDHVQVVIGQKLLPVLVAVETWIAEKAIPTAEHWGSKFVAAAKGIDQIVGPVAQDIMTAFGPVKTMLDGLATSASTVGDAISHIPGFGGGTDWYAPGAPGNPTPVGHAHDKGLHALGGPVQAGEVSWVGERGPELFVPAALGSIVPNSNIRSIGARGDVHLHVTINHPTGNGLEIGNQLVSSLLMGQNRLRLKQALGLPA